MKIRLSFIFIYTILTLSLSAQIHLGKKMPSGTLDLSRYNIKPLNIDRQQHGINPQDASLMYRRLDPILLENKDQIDIHFVSHDSGTFWANGEIKSKARGLPPKDQRSLAIRLGLARAGLGGLTSWKEVAEKEWMGVRHYSFKQTFDEIPIWDGEIRLHLQGNSFSISGRVATITDSLSTLVHLSETMANSVVLDDLKVSGVSVMPATARSKHDLILPNDGMELVYYLHQGQHRLVWHLTNHPNPAERFEYFVDASSGEILDRYESLCRTHHVPNHFFNEPSVGNGLDLNGQNQTLQTWFFQGFHLLMDATRGDMFNPLASQMPNRPVGVILTLDATNTFPGDDNFKVQDLISETVNWSDPAAVSAHRNAAQAYEYFKDNFGRVSINGQGGNIISLINVVDEDGEDMDNAFWNGKAIFYGKGKTAFSSPLARSLDVAAHELTHGVIQTTANLEYRGESGALNESFADIFAVLIDRDDWQVGEEIVNVNIFKTGALRDLSDPRNGGTKLGDPGYQPDHYDIRFRGTEDNGGVHINSGIPNKAFFLFASQVGLEVAEQVYFNVLTNYLTRSSQFVDLRVAVIDAARMQFNEPTAQAAADAFASVGILGDQGGTYIEDEPVNPGDDFILATDNNESSLHLINPNGEELTEGPIAMEGVNNPPTVSDDGELVIYVDEDKALRLIEFDWNQGTAELSVLEENPIWRNIALSRDGTKLAAVLDMESDSIYIFDLIRETFEIFELSNPTTADGLIETADVLFADAMEWDHSGEWLMYDAFNSLQKVGTIDPISYWDIGFMRVWDNSKDTYGDGFISKLFSGLPENTSVANPTFAKNSPYIIAIDQYQNTGDQETLDVLGINIETGDIRTIFENNQFGFPSFSKNDDRIIFNADDEDGNTVIGQINLADSKIAPAGNGTVLFGPAKWGVWFGNGERILSTAQLDISSTHGLQLFPNPTEDRLYITAEDWDLHIPIQFTLYNPMGHPVKQVSSSPQNVMDLDLTSVPPGLYFLQVNQMGFRQATVKVMKQ